MSPSQGEGRGCKARLPLINPSQYTAEISRCSLMVKQHFRKVWSDSPILSTGSLLAKSFTEEGYDVVILDVLTDEIAQIYWMRLVNRRQKYNNYA